MTELLVPFFSLLERHTGIALDMTKKYLIESRLGPIAKDNGFEEVHELISVLNKSAVGALHYKAFDAITTNETSFFRDPHVYDALRSTVLPDLIRKRSKEKILKIWSAACSTGQEPYSMAILLHELIPDLSKWDIHLQATDFSQRALQKAKEGRYSQYELMRGLDRQQIQKYLSPVEHSSQFVMNKNIRDLVNFSQLNLIDAWPVMPSFDLILLRNVLIYFSQETKDKILKKMHKLIYSADGCLILGSSEMIAMSENFKITQLDRISFYKAIHR